MASTTTKNKIMKLSQAEYTTLSTTGTLTKDGVTYTYSPSDTIYVTPDSSIPLTFTNISIATNDWVDNATTPDEHFEDYAYKATITGLTGVTANLLATVIFYDKEKDSGKYSGNCDSGSNSVTIYSNDNSAITVPTIIAGVPLEVEIETQGGLPYSANTERVVGYTSNNKPIYEYNGIYQFADANTTQIDISALINIDFIISFVGTTNPSDDTSTAIPLLMGSGYCQFVPYRNSTTPCKITRGSGQYGNTPTVAFTIQYTKTTD